MKRRGVPFVIVAGHAVNIDGRIRVTEDAEKVWLRSRVSDRALLDAFTEIQAQYIGRDIDPTTGIEY